MNTTTRRFPRTTREAFGLSVREAYAIEAYKMPLYKRLIFSILRYGPAIIVLGMVALVASN